MAGPVEGTAAAMFVGRDREVARVTGLLDEARAGRGRLVLCTGEAGIGKTRFAEEIAAVAAARGVTVVWARSADRDSSPPYGLWRLALGDLPGRGRGTPGGAAELDLWSLAFGGSADRGAVSGSELDRGQRFALFSEVRQQFARTAGPAGLLLVLDDVQWADEPSLLLLAHLVRQLRGIRMLIVAACRDSQRPGEPGSEMIGMLLADANTERLALTGLPASPIAELLASAGLAASPERADVVRAETGGNPFLVREVVRMLAEQSGAAPGSVPGTVLETTSYRMAQLGPRGRDVLRAAAVAGDTFSIGVVAQMLGTAVLSLLDCVEECQAAGFLVAGDRPGDYRFSHALVRSAVVGQLTAAETLRWHNAAADAIERFHQGRLRSHLAELASHRVAGSLPGDRGGAVRACEAAAGAAAEDLAFEEAARLYRQALSAGRGEISEADRGRLELALAGVRYRSGDLPGWHDGVIDVARRAERHGDGLMLARACLEMDATGEPEWDSEICRIAERALASTELPGELRARVLARHAQALAYRGEYERADEVSREALQAAGLAGTQAATVDALGARQLACSGPDGAGERAVLAERMIAASGEARSAWVEMWGRLWRIDTLFAAGRLAVISRELADLAVCAERVPGPLGRWHLLEYSAVLAHATGRYPDAVRLARESYEIGAEMRHPMAFGNYASIVCPVAMHIGFEASGAAALMARLPPISAPGGRGGMALFPAVNMALASLERGDRDGAVRAYEQAGPVRTWHPPPAFWLPALANGLAPAIGLGRAGDIAYLAGQLEPYRGRHIACGAGAGGYSGPVELHLGKAAAALGSLDAAAGDLEEAAGICDAAGSAGFAVEASVELAAVLAERGTRADRDRAVTVLAGAAPAAERLGMGPFAERIAGLRGRLPAAGPPPSPLSPREQEVARLVGQGLTNRQIAEALYLSERTAQNHVQHILTKLGFSNRSQIAAWSSAPPG